MHSQDHVDSEHVSYVGVDHKGAEFIGNKQQTIQSLTHIQTLSLIGPTKTLLRILRVP